MKLHVADRMLRAKREKMWGLAFAAPALLFFIAFSVYPFFKGLSMAFFEVNIFESRFVGFGNYKEMFESARFWAAFNRTLWYTAINVPLCSAIPFIISVMAIRASKAFQYYIRFAFYIPTLSSGITIIALWKWIFHPTRGFLNATFGFKIAWLGTNPYAFWATEITIIFCSLGGSIILYMAKLLSVPKDYFEAAEIDGCGPIKATWYVTAPLVAPIVFYMLIMNTIGFMQTWLIPFVMTGGGPNYGTTTLVLMIYQNAIQFGRWGYGAAMSSILLVAILALSLWQRRFVRNRW